MIKMSGAPINNIEGTSESYLRRHLGWFITISIIITIITLVTIFAYLPINKSDHDLIIDMKKHAEDPNESCANLQLIVSVVGNGIFSLDPKEKDLHDYAQLKLDNGDCIK